MSVVGIHRFAGGSLRTPRVAVVALVLAATLGATPARAAPQWHALDGAPPGTPPTVVLMTGSNLQQTVLDVTVHGFWVEPVQQLSQTFLKLRLDRGHSGTEYGQLGLPELPAIHHLLGSVLGTTVGTPTVQVLDEVTIPGALVWPLQPSVSVNDPAPPFQWNQAFYQQTSQPYPSARAAGRPYLGRLSKLDLLDDWDDTLDDETEAQFNVAQFVLFGDPDMKLWRERSIPPLIGGYPISVGLGGGPIQVQVQRPGSSPASQGRHAAVGSPTPLPLAIVSLYKPGCFQLNRYTDSQGIASLSVPACGPGWIYLTVHTEFDEHAVATDSILVTNNVGIRPGADAVGVELSVPAPNPMSRGGAISFTLPRAGRSRLVAFDVSGRRVATLLDADRPAGRHRIGWDGAGDDERPLAPGLYLLTLEFGGESRTRKVAVVR